MTRQAHPRTAHSVFGNATIVTFLFAQAADGTLTYLGVRTLGLGIEGNPLLLALMVTIGAAPAVLGAKFMAAVLGISLHMLGVHRIVAALTAFYLAGAVLPWVSVLASQI